MILTAEVVSKKFKRVVTDSRKASAGDLFVALPGEKFDGHDFVEQVLVNGASGVVVSSKFAKLADLKTRFNDRDFFEVTDALDAFRKLGHDWRMQFKIPVIAVAGSVGKTTTKEMLAAVLKGKFKSVLKTEGSQNGFIGIPMTLLELRPHHDVAVIEVGIDECGTMTGHMDVVHPTHALLTKIGPEHLEKLVDVPTVAKEEGLALEWIGRHGGTALVRIDDEWVAPLAKKLNGTKAQVVECGVGMNVKYIGDDAIELTQGVLAGERIKSPLPGAHNLSNLVNAVTMALHLGLNDEEIREGLETFQTAYGRTEIRKKEINGSPCTILCDYYNANPSSMVAALELLSGMALKEKCGETIACMGDMKELGTFEEKFHRDLANDITRLKISKVYLYGQRMAWLFDELRKKKFDGCKLFESQEALAAALKEDVMKPSMILIKGSRSMKMEVVFTALFS